MSIETTAEPTLAPPRSVTGEQQKRGLLHDHASLIVYGPDKPGIVAAVTALITRNKGNIVSLDQYTDDPTGGAFFQRVVFHCRDLKVAMTEIENDLETTLGALGLTWKLTDQSIPKRMGILASTSDHCLLDLLWRHRRGELPVTIPMVISNHSNAADDVRSFGVPFFHVPSSGTDKSAAEAQIVKLLAENVDFIVLARYMQILSPDFLKNVGVPVINIHHSFLPAFIGAAPYKKAKARGVKLIGATSHYVTEELDEGPIIEQDVVRVTHAESAADLQRRGADVERAVLSRAVLWHAEDRVIRHQNQTIVF
ncbi:formyltetrahydrofolate deformylase [Paenarthrobacter ureafaciens]|uniref:formyltetrahydrofolate deformylase n=1 Tax=Paenarthrobacter TaxID=1742992 RepID=UPI0015B7C2AC|nr:MULTISPECIES: formyltetrahydrofolate deformylase [Paenarthrobacter]NWL26718.1 formyltetrahydrofolate deformylase [Paenarthrobacter ureafaciens]NWL32013.1 formyltetrahydrofolate deformylase [Paenarthrobacter nitroguajacolicus]